MLTAGLIFVSLAALTLSGFGPVRTVAAVVGAAAGGGVAVGLKALAARGKCSWGIALLGAPLGIAAADWILSKAGLAPSPGPSLRAAALAAAAGGLLLALSCAAIDHFIRAPHGPDEWPRSHVASALAAAAFASAAGWALGL